jgi:Zn-dependent protease with chaperone function
LTGSLEAEYRRYVREHGVATLFSDDPPDAPPSPYASGDFEQQDAERTIRDLEAARRYLTYSTVGTEPHMDWLYRLGTVASRKGPYQGPLVRSLRETLNRRTDDVRRGMQRLGRSWPAVHVDLFPTGDLNAMSVPAPGGHLVLVNTGLMNLVFNVLKIHVLSQRIGPTDEDAAQVTEAQVALLLAEALNAYIYGAGSWMTWSTPPLQGRRSDLIAPTLALCEDFVLAHELGHVLAGDRVEAVTYLSAPVEAPVPGLDIPVAAHDAELAADRLAAEIVRAAFGVDESIGPADERSLYAGLLFFFLVDEAVRSAKNHLDAAAAQRRSGAITTHPPGAERMERLVAAFPPRHDTSLTLVRSFGVWFEHYLPSALAHIEEVNRTIIRRDEPWWRIRDGRPGAQN